MTTTSTPTLQLSKPTPGTGQLVSVGADLNANWDKVDAFASALIDGGKFSFGASTQSISATTNTLLNQWAAVGSPNNVSHAAGVFTIARDGVYDIEVSIRVQSGTSTATYLWIYGTNIAGDVWAKDMASASNVSVSFSDRFTAGSTFRVGCWSAGAIVIGRESVGDLVPAVTVWRRGN